METGNGEGCSTQISPVDVSIDLVTVRQLFFYDDGRIKQVVPQRNLHLAADDSLSLEYIICKFHCQSVFFFFFKRSSVCLQECTSV